MPRNDNHSIQIAVIKPRDLGRATNVIWEWARFIERLHKPAIDLNTSIVNYQKIGNDARLKLKDVGSFVGGPFKDGVRQRDNLTARSVLTLDIDDATPKQIRFIKDGKSELQKYEFAGSTTRSHTSEKPKWRLVFPMTRMVTADEYAPLSRIVASKLLVNVTQSMDATDDVSFRVAQVMFWPSQCHDGEFDLIHNEGDLLDPDAVLGAFGDWRDWLQLPYSEKRGQKRPTTVRKAENPLEKPGMIGGFCRAYRVPAAIAKFLPTIYTPGDKRSKKPRYTYVAGSGANGAVVEDDGLFLYSNHGTDPCGERLVNAFDLVRIHLFGDLDNGIADDVAQTKRPSFEAMKKSLDDDPLVKSEMLKAELDLESEFDEEDEPAAAPKGEPAGLFDDLLGDSKPKPRAWQLDFETDSKGNILSSLTNIRLIIMNDKRLRGRIQYSEFTQDIRTRLPLNPRLPDMLPTKVADPLTGELWTDYHDKVVRAIIESPRGKNGGGYGLKVSDRDLKNTVEIVARQFAYHPVKEFVEGITWDGVPRVETLFIDYLGAPDNPYTRETARAMLTALVTRTYEPGHKFDYVVVLEGAQGKRKSTFIEALAGCPLWFVEMTGDLGDRKGIVEKMQNKTICEFPELAGFTKADVEDLKALISSHSDTVRFAFAESAQDYKRKSIFIGSTNDKQYLRDLTGGRRFWPMAVLVDEIDTDAFAKIVPQLWAEARAIYLKMRAAQPMGNLPLFLRNRHSQKIAAALQENARQHVSEDLWKGLFEEYLDSPLVIEDDDADLDAPVKTRERFEVTLIELWTEVMGRARNDYRSGDGMILSRTMSMIKGWENIGPRRTVAHGMQRVYRKTAFDAHGNKTPERPVLKRKPIDMLD